MNQSKHVNRFRLVATTRGWSVQLEAGSGDDLVRRLFGPGPAAMAQPGGQLTVAVAELMVRARRQGMQIDPKGLLSDPLLVLSEAPSKETAPGVLSPFKELRGIYAAHWGITDLYPEHAKALREALASQLPMDTREFGAKKEIQFAQVCRLERAGPITVRVRCESDDPVALSDTAFWQAAGGNSAGDSGLDVLYRIGMTKVKARQEIERLAGQSGIEETNEASRAAELPAGASYDDVIATIERLTDECDQQLEARSTALTEAAARRLASLKGTGE